MTADNMVDFFSYLNYECTPKMKVNAERKTTHTIMGPVPEYGQDSAKFALQQTLWLNFFAV